MTTTRKQARGAAVEAGSGRSRIGRIAGYENLPILLALAVIVGLFGLAARPGTFLTPLNFANIALNGSQLLILASGVTFLLIAGGLDLSIGGVIILSSVLAGKTILWIAGPIAVSGSASAGTLWLASLAGLAVALSCGAFWGFVNAEMVVRLGLPPLIATLASLSISFGLAQIVSDGVNVTSLPIQLQSGFGGARLFGLVPFPVIVAALILGIAWVVLAKTRFGLRTYAIGGSAQAAARAGIDVPRHMRRLYVAVGMLSGVVAFVDLARFGTASLAGHTQDALNVIAAVVIGGVSLFGGRGRMSGALIGVLIPTVLANGLVIIHVVPFWQNVVVGLVLVAAVYTDQLRRGSRSRET